MGFVGRDRRLLLSSPVDGAETGAPAEEVEMPVPEGGREGAGVAVCCGAPLTGCDAGCGAGAAYNGGCCAP